MKSKSVKIFKVFLPIHFFVNHVTPPETNFNPRVEGHSLNNLSRGPLDDVTYQI